MKMSTSLTEASVLGNLNGMQSNEIVCTDLQKAATYRTQGILDESCKVPSRGTHVQSQTGQKGIPNLSKLLMLKSEFLVKSTVNLPTQEHIL